MLMRTAKPERTAPLAGAALAIAVVGAATILGAYFFEYVLHYQPCPLCLEQRIPYYVGIPLALVLALAAKFAAPRVLLIAGFTALALALFIGAGLAAYHAGDRRRTFGFCAAHEHWLASPHSVVWCAPVRHSAARRSCRFTRPC